MLGFRRLTHDATATVVSSRRHVGTLLSGGFTNNQGWDWTPFDLIVDVHPEGAAPFRTEVRKHFGSMHAPQAGDRIGVRCNPRTRRVRLRTKGDPRYDRSIYHDAGKQAAQAEHDRLLRSPPGTPPPPAP